VRSGEACHPPAYLTAYKLQNEIDTLRMARRREVGGMETEHKSTFRRSSSFFHFNLYSASAVPKYYTRLLMSACLPKFAEALFMKDCWEASMHKRLCKGRA
jgi:hypothetical protein